MHVDHVAVALSPLEMGQHVPVEDLIVVSPPEMVFAHVKLDTHFSMRQAIRTQKMMALKIVN